MGAELPVTHPAITYALQAAVKIKRVTDGRVELQVFPNNSLGSGANLLSQVRLGAIEFLQAGDNYLGSLAHEAYICTVPFAFADMQAALKAMDGPLGKRVRAAVAKVGLYPFAKSWPVGIRQVCNSIRPINAPSDFNGLKIRTPDDPIEVAFFRALGATPTPSIPTNQNYLALQTHLVDGADTPISAMEALKLYEVQKYVSYTNHSYVEFTTVANADAWQRLPADLRSAVDASINEAALGYRGELAKLEASARGDDEDARHDLQPPEHGFGNVSRDRQPGWDLRQTPRRLRARGLGPAREVGREAHLKPVRQACRCSAPADPKRIDRTLASSDGSKVPAWL